MVEPGGHDHLRRKVVSAPPRSVHFAGIAGKGIAPAAGLALQAGWNVSGHDLVENHRIPALRAAGADIVVGRNIEPPAGTSVQVRSSLVTSTGTTAERSRLAFVDDVMRDAGNRVITVAGSVGKSTLATAIWSAHASIKPACYIGADVPGTLCGGSWAASSTGIVEADEYKGAYFDLTPDTIVLINVVSNHEDCFGPGTAGFSTSFADWVEASELEPGSVIISSAAAETLRQDGRPVPCVTVGLQGERSDWTVHVVGRSPSATTVRIGGGRIHDDFEVPLAGDAAAAVAFAIVTARESGVADPDIRHGLRSLRLPFRRQTLVHRHGEVWVYDDNARLALQFVATMEALRQRHPDARIVAIISPWGRLNRRDIGEWAEAGSRADHLLVLPVGDASSEQGGPEQPDADMQLVASIRKLGGDADAVSSWVQLPDPTGPTVYVTAGYDAQLPMFTGAHDHLRRRFPQA